MTKFISFDGRIIQSKDVKQITIDNRYVVDSMIAEQQEFYLELLTYEGVELEMLYPNEDERNLYYELYLKGLNQ